jgi:hypothetical protein
MTLEEKRKYQREWVANRKQKWLDENGPCVICGSDFKLEIDHINPKIKTTHSIWSWSEKRRNVELKKCQILCEKCHQNKTTEYVRSLWKGKHRWSVCKLNPIQMEQMREFRKTHTTLETGKKFGIHRTRVTRLLELKCQ